jgi:hypothetical protein
MAGDAVAGRMTSTCYFGRRRHRRRPVRSSDRSWPALAAALSQPGTRREPFNNRSYKRAYKGRTRQGDQKDKAILKT